MFQYLEYYYNQKIDLNTICNVIKNFLDKKQGSGAHERIYEELSNAQKCLTLQKMKMIFLNE